MRIVDLPRNVDGAEIAGWEPGPGTRRKSAVALAGPLHRRAASVAPDWIEFAVGGNDRIAHADFFAIINERGAAKREEHHGCDSRPRFSLAIPPRPRDVPRKILVGQSPPPPHAAAQLSSALSHP